MHDLSGPGARAEGKSQSLWDVSGRLQLLNPVKKTYTTKWIEGRFFRLPGRSRTLPDEGGLKKLLWRSNTASKKRMRRVSFREGKLAYISNQSLFSGYLDNVKKFITKSMSVVPGIPLICWCISMTNTPVPIKYGLPVSVISTSIVIYHNWVYCIFL